MPKNKFGIYIANYGISNDPQDYIDLAITSWYSTWVKPCDAPDISYIWATILEDNTPDADGNPKGPKVVDTVPLLFVDEIGILDTKALNRIIKPAIQEVNGWSLVDPVSWYYNLKNEWDSWFVRAGYNFKWNGGDIYHSSDINYIVGGHAFHHYGFTWDQMYFMLHLWKYDKYGHLIDDPALIPTKIWAVKGYNEWVFRNRW